MENNLGPWNPVKRSLYLLYILIPEKTLVTLGMKQLEKYHEGSFRIFCYVEANKTLDTPQGKKFKQKSLTWKPVIPHKNTPSIAYKLLNRANKE